jgi:N-acetyl-anhydromuramyl-L-alanine amidase AmpD
VEKSGRIGQLVHDKDTAWHAGVSTVNQVSIGIEHANDTFSPNWTISSATLENGAHLVAALCVYYKLGRPTWGKNLFGHYNYVSTACPGALRYAQGNTYVARAQYWYDQMTGTQPAPTPPATATKPNLGALLRKGSKGTAVTNLQKRLVALGYKLPRYGADGVFGSETDTAVRAFQRDKKLAVDGIVGANTAHALGWTFQGK